MNTRVFWIISQRRLTFLREEFPAQIPSCKKTGRRGPEKTYYFGEVCSTPVRLEFRVFTGEQGPAFKNIPNLRREV